MTATTRSACKSIVGGRIKGSGRRWNEEGAKAMIALRCAHANGEVEEHYERRRQDNILQLRRLSSVRRPRAPMRLAA